MSKVGTHLARSTGPDGVKFGMSANNNLQIAITFQFVNQEDSCYGQSIVWIGTFATGKASEIALEAMENCGWSGEDVMDLDGIDANDVELVIVEEWNQDRTKQYEKVAFVNRPGANRFTFQNPVEGPALAAQSRALNQSIRAIRASQGRTVRSAPKPQTGRTPQQRTEQNGDEEFQF
jgi:uncharacterized protein YdbL (DUF1318 family)